MKKGECHPPFFFTRYDVGREPETAHSDCVTFFGAQSPSKNCSPFSHPVLLYHVSGLGG